MNVRIVKNSEREMELEVLGEGHTLGNLLAKELQSMEEVELAYYEIPHPLQPKMTLFIKTREGASPQDVLNKALKNLESQLEQVEQAFRKALGV